MLAVLQCSHLSEIQNHSLKDKYYRHVSNGVFLEMSRLNKELLSLEDWRTIGRCRYDCGVTVRLHGVGERRVSAFGPSQKFTDF